MREGRNGGKLKSGGNNGGGRPKKLPSIIEKLVQTQFEFLKCPNKNAA
jgi:hypothetical protein